LCLEHVEHWESIASRWRPALSSHLRNGDYRNVAHFHGWNAAGAHDFSKLRLWAACVFLKVLIAEGNL
jgi:hypothetical protein